MKLSKLTKMAALALDAQESGDETAAPELHAFCMAHLDDVVSVLSTADDVTRKAIREHAIETFPKSLLKTCQTRRIREAARDAERSRKDVTVAAAASALRGTVSLDGISYRFDGAALAELAKRARPGDTFFFGVDGYKHGLRVPARVLRDLNRVHPLKDCDVHMTSPVYGDWRIIVQWSPRGYWQSRMVTAQERDMAAICAPSMTALVTRELGIEAA